MASLTITPGRPLRGTITLPGDKSITHRAIILSALAEGISTVSDYCRGEDCLDTMRAFQSLGVRIEETPDRLQVHGKGMWGLTEPAGPIDCGNSGTGIRLMTGLLAGQDFFTVLTGDESIRRRPMGRVVKPLRSMGATIAGRKGGELAPLAITGSRLRGMTYSSPVAGASRIDANGENRHVGAGNDRGPHCKKRSSGEIPRNHQPLAGPTHRRAPFDPHRAPLAM